MYNEFFGFKENPFLPIPDPKFLFLGKSHEEALAHLVYAVSQGEGFISLIGERGVGKTTICRKFIDSLDKNTEVAYISNPKLSSEDLLKTINTAFKLRADADNVKDLIDPLNSFLMKKRLEGKKVVLFLDNAQDLTGDVLEQVRLLSNLETTRDKLLQIVLVGEPRLADMLGSHELRQIGQRVSVSYYISPLSYDETRDYIRYRINIASQGFGVRFDPAALKQIFRYSNGIPRMINMACDKALLIAYGLRCSGITGDIVGTAVLALTGRQVTRRFAFLNRRRAALTAAGCGLLAFVAFGAYYAQRTDEKALTGKNEAIPAPVKQLETPRVMPVSKPSPQPAVVKSEKSLEPPEPKEAVQEVAAVPAAVREPEKRSQLITPMTHSIQVGAFRIRNQAQKLMAGMIAKGYQAQIVTVTDSGEKIWYTVRIGDYPSREIAREHADAFSARERMESAVRPYGKL